MDKEERCGLQECQRKALSKRRKCGVDEPRAGAWYGARLDAKGRDLRTGVRFQILEVLDRF
jgi:hypothetical protein